jgi:hypothetical protein
MRPLAQLLHAARLGAVVGLVVLTGAADGRQSSSISKKNDPAGTGPMMGQLRALFAEWDQNQDGFLEREEVVVGFRDLAKRPDPRRSGKASKKAAKGGAKTPEAEFLARVDLNGDGIVNRDEYLNWAREYAVLQKNVVAAGKRVAKTEARLLTNLKATSRIQAEADLMAQRQELVRLAVQLPPFEELLQRYLAAPPASGGARK